MKGAAIASEILIHAHANHRQYKPHHTSRRSSSPRGERPLMKLMLSSRKVRRILAVVTSIIVLSSFAQVSFADEAPDAQSDGAAALGAGDGRWQASAGACKGETAASTPPTPPSVVIPGAEMTIAINQPSFLLIRYAAESACFGAPTGHCSVRIMVNGRRRTLHPASTSRSIARTAEQNQSVVGSPRNGALHRLPGTWQLHRPCPMGLTPGGWPDPNVPTG